MAGIQRTIVLAVVWFFCALPAASLSGAAEPRVDLEFDTGPAATIVNLFDSAYTDRDIQTLLAMPAVRETIAQTRQFDASASAEVFAASLRAVLNGRTPDADPFGFVRIRERLDDIRRGLDLLNERRQPLAREIRRRVSAYTPPGISVSTRIVVVLGGTSDGWAPGDGNFYLALQYFRDDIAGLTAMATHELYHIVQPRFFKPLDAGADEARRLLAATLAEGTATLVGNPTGFDGDGRHLGFLKDKHRRNLARIELNIQLFELLYFRLRNDPELKLDDVYNLGFSGALDSPLYFVGFQVAESIERHLGTQALLRMLSEQSAEQVFAAYVRLYCGEPSLTAFSATVEALLLESATSPAAD